MDMSADQRASARFVTARELGRRTGELLDAVGRGTRIVVTRWGRPLCVIEPTEDVVLFARARQAARNRMALDEWGDAPREDRPGPDLTTLGVDGYVLDVLESLERLGTHDAVIRDTGLPVSKTGAALGSLEVRKLIKRVHGGYAVTDDGLRVVGAWRRLDEEARQAVSEAIRRNGAGGRD